MVTPGTAAQFKNLTASGTPYDKAQTQVGTADQLQMVLMDAGILTEEGRDLNSKLWEPKAVDKVRGFCWRGVLPVVPARSGSIHWGVVLTEWGE